QLFQPVEVTHAMWLYYWLASAGINPFDDVRTVVVLRASGGNSILGELSNECVASQPAKSAFNFAAGCAGP
ncbi:ABC transporter substrate-binding protein, partial [Enterobacter hormaechei]|uniref:ABC transporter substrate-binding protein n=1 Tax=Enterobacter hormaechei TaxID=158836 RepID=UPI0030EC1404